MKINVTLVDKKDNILGYREKYLAHKNPVSLHRAVSVVIYDKEGKKMLLQKRAKGKPTWPLIWSNACCSHPLPDESYKEAAQRRIGEELGFMTPLKEVFKFIYKVRYDEDWGEHELDHVFVGSYSGKVNPNKDEVDQYKWINLIDLEADIAKNPTNYTPWFRLILEQLKVTTDL